MRQFLKHYVLSVLLFNLVGCLSMQTVSVEDDSAWTYILGALGIAALVVLVANADSVKVCTPSPCP